MWGKKNKRITRIDSLIGQDTQIEGDIHFKGGLHIDGHLKGNIDALGDDQAALTLSEQGCIEGDIRVPHVVLNGQVKGDVYASTHLELAPDARVHGNVYYKLLEMMMGAEVNGNLIHQYPEPVADEPNSKQTVKKSLHKPNEK